MIKLIYNQKKGNYILENFNFGIIDDNEIDARQLEKNALISC